MKRILIVEDEPEIGEFLLAYLQQEGYELSLIHIYLPVIFKKVI